MPSLFTLCNEMAFVFCVSENLLNVRKVPDFGYPGQFNPNCKQTNEYDTELTKVCNTGNISISIWHKIRFAGNIQNE